jgi:transcriptional regulator with XRE-family HTH domain
MNETVLDQFTADEKGTRLFHQEKLAAELTELMCKAMRERGVNRSALATLLHKSKGRISQILNAETNFTVRTVADIFTVLGKVMKVSVDDLFAPTSPRHVLATFDKPIPTGLREHYLLDTIVAQAETANSLAG